MMSTLISTLKAHPEIALFVTLALGYFFGSRHIGKFSLGTVAATLLIGVLIGQLGIRIPHVVETIFFDMFIFTVGYQVGPQFVRGLRGGGLKQVSLALIFAVMGVGGVYLTARLFGYDAGTAAGMLGGALSQSSVIGSATDAIQRLGTSEEARMAMAAAVPVAYAVTYVFGEGGVAWFLSKIGPKILGIDLRAECVRTEREMTGRDVLPAGIRSAFLPTVIRAYRVENEAFCEHTVAHIEETIGYNKLVVERVRINGGVHKAKPEETLHRGNVVSVVIDRDVLVDEGKRLGPEVIDDKDVLDLRITTRNVVVTNREVDGMTLGELGRRTGRGLRLQKLVRLGQELPFARGTVVNRGDTLTIVGDEEDVNRAAGDVGYVERRSVDVDVTYVGLGIALGALIGVPAIMFGRIPLGLGSATGALLMGLIFGWLRTRYPVFGRFPTSAQWVFTSIGLNGFVACVGLNAAAGFLAGLRDKGLSLLIAGVLVALIPHVVILLVGKHVFKMNPAILLGTAAGAGTLSAGVAALAEEADSQIPALGFAVPAAINNVVLTLCGPILVFLLAP
jgi:putative transport protein